MSYDRVLQVSDTGGNIVIDQFEDDVLFRVTVGLDDDQILLSRHDESVTLQCHEIQSGPMQR